MNRAFRCLCVVLAVILSAMCLTACSLFDNTDDGGDGAPEETEILLSDDSDPFVIEVGQTITVSVLSPIGDPVWESVDPQIASVTNSGDITGVSTGSTVLAVSVGEHYAVRTVVVTPALTPDDPDNPDNPDNPDVPEEKDVVTVSQSAIGGLEVGSSVKLTATSSKGGEITWQSLDQNIATVDGDGTVYGLNIGSTTVIARSKAGGVGSCNVNVVPVETIKLNRTRILVRAGETAELIATASNGSKVVWSCSDTSIAQVEGGVITAKKTGNATVYATIPNGKRAECELTVLSSGEGVPQMPGYTLTWNDEFDGAALDTTKWGYQLGVRDSYNGVDSDAWFWGNGELQYYTNSTRNVNVSSGVLNITAIKENMDYERTYSSARIVTRDKFSQTFGYFEARMKTPVGNGMWPAFWMLPQPDGSWGMNNGYGGWPHSGEIDIMEAKGRLNDVTDHTLHFSIHNGGQHQYLGTSKKLSSNTDEWHKYAVDWTPDYIIWYVDDEQVYRLNARAWETQASTSPSAPFDKPFYILLNLAVGGQYDGWTQPDDGFTSATMQVDYVRVYQNNTYL